MVRISSKSLVGCSISLPLSLVFCLHSLQTIVGHLEVLLNYGDRFYQRQFITRKVSSHDILTRLKNLLTDRFESGVLSKKGLQTVLELAAALNVSPNYLSTNLSVSEIAYELGFSQSFSKLFKTNTHLSPVECLQSFNE